MKDYYVSLVRDLFDCYLVFFAESELAVRQYLAHEYFVEETSTWKLPWCSIYTEKPRDSRHIIKSTCGPLYESREL
jgi:hypothetical protein